MSRYALVVVLAVMVLAGCAGRQEMTAGSMAQQATSLQIPKGMAELYLFNGSGWTLIPGNLTVTDNGTPIATLPRQTYTRLFIAAGLHVLRPEHSLWRQELTLNAEAGARYYVLTGCRPERSWAKPTDGPPMVIRLLSDEEVRRLIGDMTLQ